MNFFEHIFRDAAGYAAIVLPGPEGKPTDTHWFQYPTGLDAMNNLVKENQHRDVWFSPVLYQSESRTKDNAKYLAITGADADTCDPSNFRLEPSITVQTSPGRWHVYFVLDTKGDAAEVATVNRRIAQVHKDEGCDVSFVNAAKLMRVPGTSNHKHPGAVVTIVADSEKTYTLAEVAALYPASEVPDQIQASEPDDMPAGLAEYIQKNRSGLLNGLPNTISLRELLFGNPPADKRSEMRFLLLCELYKLGLEDVDVMAIAWGSPTNKYRTEDSRSYGGLWAEAMKAKTTVEQGQAEVYDTPVLDSKPQSIPTPKKAPKRERTSFLNDAEQEQIKQHITFIDEWVAWAKTKTDAPAEFHRAAAMTVLSVVLSEFGHATPKFAPKGMRLNLWFMVLGRSTKDRKSTARSYMNAAFRALKDDQYSYTLGEDVTPGGISLALHDRANRASIYDRDEVQGLFKELLHQSYMTGGLEVFTKLYDGWSGGRLRASGDKKIMHSVPVSFIMFLMGILDETADTLTITNYKSGFLTRFLYVVGERPEGYVAPPVEQSDEDGGGEDKVFAGLMSHMVRRRSWWSLRVPGEGQTSPVRVQPDAWKRFQEYTAQVNDAAAATPYAEIIGTTSERMTWSVLKLACLLAMDDMSTEVKMHHMLQAIAYSGEWFDNACLMASKVSASEWERQVDDLYDYIMDKGGMCSYANAYRAFRGIKQKEFEDMLGSLQGRGMLERTQEGGRWVLRLIDAT